EVGEPQNSANSMSQTQGLPRMDCSSQWVRSSRAGVLLLEGRTRMALTLQHFDPQPCVLVPPLVARRSGNTSAVGLGAVNVGWAAAAPVGPTSSALYCWIASRPVRTSSAPPSRISGPPERNAPKLRNDHRACFPEIESLRSRRRVIPSAPSPEQPPASTQG